VKELGLFGMYKVRFCTVHVEWAFAKHISTLEQNYDYKFTILYENHWQKVMCEKCAGNCSLMKYICCYITAREGIHG
jgi:hypothetical protein